MALCRTDSCLICWYWNKHMTD